jgi:regulator of RNase E activity RraA
MNAPTDMDLIKQLKQLSTANVSDALDKLGLKSGIIGIRPTWACAKIAGRAVTIKLTAAGMTMSKHHLGTEAIDVAEAGDVIVLDTEAAPMSRAGAAFWRQRPVSKTSPESSLTGHAGISMTIWILGFQSMQGTRFR